MPIGWGKRNWKQSSLDQDLTSRVPFRTLVGSWAWTILVGNEKFGRRFFGPIHSMGSEEPIDLGVGWKVSQLVAGHSS